MSDLWNNWLSYLRTMDEAKFFSLYRHYLGEFPRPFNKTQLVNNLLSFIRDPQINKTLRLGLHETQRQLLTLIKVYMPISKDDLIYLWEKSFSLLPENSTFNKIYDNLEKKLLVFESPIHGEPHVFPSPAVSGPEWDEWLNPRLLCRGRVLESDNEIQPFSELPWVVGLFLIEKNPHLNRKKFKKKLSQIFPNTVGANLILDELIRLQLVRDYDDQLSLNWGEWRFLAQKSPTERLLFLLAAQDELYDELETVKAVAQLVERLPRHLCFTTKELLHVFVWVTSEVVGAHSVWAYALRNWLESRLPSEKLCLKALPPVQYQTRLTVNPNHELIAEECDLSLGLLLAQCSRLVRVERILVTQLDQNAVNRFLQRGGNIQKLISSLERYTKAPLPQNIAFTLRQWAKQYHFVSIRSGVLVSIKDQLLPLFKSQRPESYPDVLELGLGRYFFSQNSWSNFCQKSKKLPWNREPQAEINTSRFSFWQLSKQKTISYPPPPPVLKDEDPPSLPLKAELDNFLHQKPEGIQKLAFSFLVQAGLIVSPTQFEHVWDQCAPLEISGMNHQGKIQTLVEAIQSGNRLLIIEYAIGPDQKEVYQVRPRHLSGKQPSAKLEAFDVNTNQPIFLVVTKMLRLCSVKIDL